MLNINQFTTDINTRGVLKNNKYLATIYFESGHYLSRRQNELRSLQVRCDSATLPGVQFASADGPPRLGYGPVERHPYNVMFDELSLSFIVDANSDVHKTLYDWMNCIVNFKGKGASDLFNANGPSSGSSSSKPWAAYEVGYRDNYAAKIVVEVFKDSGSGTKLNRSMTFTAYNAFPMGFPSTSVDWNSSDLMRLKIPFAYTDYEIKYDSSPEFSSDRGTAAGEASNARSETLALNTSITNNVGRA